MMSDAVQSAPQAKRKSAGRRSVWWQPIVSLAFGVAFAFSLSILFAAKDHAVAAEATEEREAGFATLTSAELASMLPDEDFFLVNVHIPYEGEIEGTDAFIAFDEIGANLDRLPPDQAARIVLYCRSGRMSETAATELSRLGYGNVAHLGGGMIDWKANGHRVIEK